MKANWKTCLGGILAGIGIIVAGFLLIQIIPIGKNHTNPPVVAEPQWDSQQTRALFMQACGDCHSNQTTWPWYSNIAPVSWLVYRDVVDGRRRFNVSEWGASRNRGREAAETVQRGRMPPGIYLVEHPSANLTASDKALLVQGLAATFGSGFGLEGGGGGDN